MTADSLTSNGDGGAAGCGAGCCVSAALLAVGCLVLLQANPLMRTIADARIIIVLTVLMVSFLISPPLKSFT